MPSYEADIARFEGVNTHVLGISVDSVPCNAAWAKSLGGISYDLLSDFEPKGEVARKYGVLRAEGFTERALFVIDKQGKIIYKDVHKIDEQPDNEEIFKVLRSAA
jgi:peroxiredoxin